MATDKEYKAVIDALSGECERLHKENEELKKALENHDTFMKYSYEQGKQDALSQEPCDDAISINSMVETIATKVTEDTEKFIFETITPYCEEITKREISKKDLERALTQYFSKEPCEDAISRDAVIEATHHCGDLQEVRAVVQQLPPVNPQPSEHFIDGVHAMGYREGYKDAQKQKSGKCKNCKWWRDSDGVYRRGVGAESKCPINNVSVNHGFGYCYMFEPQESEDKE